MTTRCKAVSVNSMTDTKKVQDTAKRIPPRAGMGRPKGATNKLTTTVREAILAAFDEVGGADYLAQQAKDNPVAFMSLLAKVLPTQIDLKTKGEPIKIIVERAEPKPINIIENDNARNPAALN
jgi:hypothetical protein